MHAYACVIIINTISASASNKLNTTLSTCSRSISGYTSLQRRLLAPQLHERAYHVCVRLHKLHAYTSSTAPRCISRSRANPASARLLLRVSAPRAPGTLARTPRRRHDPCASHRIRIRVRGLQSASTPPLPAARADAGRTPAGATTGRGNKGHKHVSGLLLYCWKYTCTPAMTSEWEMLTRKTRGVGRHTSGAIKHHPLKRCVI